MKVSVLNFTFCLFAFVLVFCPNGFDMTSDCKNLNVVFYVDTQIENYERDSLANYRKIKEVLSKYIDHLHELSESKPMIDIQVSFMSYSARRKYWHKFIPVYGNRLYLQQIIENDIPMQHSRLDLLGAFKDLLKYMNTTEQHDFSNSKNVFILILGKATLNYSEETEWLYFENMLQAFNILKKSFWFHINNHHRSPDKIWRYFSSEPNCNYFTQGEDQEQLQNGIMFLVDSVCNELEISKNCKKNKDQNDSVPCIVGKDGETKYVSCDSKLLGKNFEKTFEIEILNKKKFKNADYVEIKRFEFVGLNSSHMQKLFKQTKTLILNDDNIAKITRDMLENLYGLETLDLAYNSIVSIEDKSFENLNKLTKLSLNNNLLKSLNELTFRGLDSLIHLLLTDNELDRIDNETFCSLQNLHYLTLSNNKISKLDINSFNNLRNLITLDLSDNMIQSLPLKVFTPLENILAIILAGNQLNSLEVDWPYSIRWLLLNINKLNYINPNLFTNITQLKILELADNYLTDIKFVLSSKDLYSIGFSKQHGNLRKLNETFFKNLINVGSELYLHLEENEIIFEFDYPLNTPITSLFNRNGLEKLSLYLSLRSFVKLIQTNMYWLRHFSVKNGFTIVYLWDIETALEQADQDSNIVAMRDSIVNNCDLRLIMGILNIFISKLSYPSFGLSCSNSSLLYSFYH